MFKRILVPIDFSEGSEKAVLYGVSLAKQFDSDLYLLHVIDERLIDAAFFDNIAIESDKLKIHKLREKSSLAEMDIFSKGIRDKYPDVRILEKITCGIAFVEIIKYARKHDMDMIVIGSHGKTNLVHMLLGSTTEKVVRKAPCTVLAVRPHEHDFVSP